MKTIDRLKVLYKERYLEINDYDRWQDAMDKYWPRILAVVEAGEALADSISIRRRDRLFGDTSDLGQALIKYLKSQDAMNEEP